MGKQRDRLRGRLRRAEKGQSLVEMAVGMVILVMLVSGLLDLGRLWYLYIALEDAAGEAALYLSLDPFCIDDIDPETSLPYKRPDGSACSDPNNAMYRAQNAVGPNVFDWGIMPDPIVIVPRDPVTNEALITVGESVSVELSYPVEMLTPVIPRFTGINPLILRSKATQMVIRVYQDNR